MKCLQKKYDKLEPECKAAVRNFTQMTMSDPTLDFLLMKACEPMIQLFCSVNRITLQAFFYLENFSIEY
jgi:Golgi apparatus protein 1